MAKFELGGHQFDSTQALVDVLQERVRQDERWGVTDHHPFAWLAILMKQVDEFSEYTLNGNFDEWTPENLANMRKEAVQVAAVALAIVECADRNNE